MVFDVKNKTFYLYKKSKVNYDDLSLAADRIKVNWETSIMYSNGVKDSTGRNQGLPLFEQKSLPNIIRIQSIIFYSGNSQHFFLHSRLFSLFSTSLQLLPTFPKFIRIIRSRL
jgi:hypothetical protein